MYSIKIALCQMEQQQLRWPQAGAATSTSRMGSAPDHLRSVEVDHPKMESLLSEEDQKVTTGQFMPACQRKAFSNDPTVISSFCTFSMPCIPHMYAHISKNKVYL